MIQLRKNLVLLIVDDDKDMRETVCFEFQMRGLKFFEAGDGNEALKILATEKIDLVISDIRMPNRDGISLLETMRQKNGVMPPLIFMSGFADIAIWDAYDFGAEAFFGKPFDIEKIVSYVDLLTKPRNLLWSEKIREEPKHTLALTFKDPEHAASDEGFSIGRGGIFLGAWQNKFRRDDTIGFKLEIAGSTLAIEGTGILRWVRTSPSEGLPAGCGIEFSYLNPEIKNKYLQITEKSQPIAYIPRGPRKKNGVKAQP